MKRGRLVVLRILLLLCALALSGCSTQTSESAGADISVRVVATQSFGQELMFDETLEVPPGTSAMEALARVADVETAYGGGFVKAINGVRSGGAKGDWFICVNGIRTNVGALDYTLRDGDIQRWDIHDWRFRMFIPAVVGDFPEPFLHGYGGKVYPTVIVYEDGLEEIARDLESSLQGLGVVDVSAERMSDLRESERQHSNLILVGTLDCSLVSQLNQPWDRLGFFIHFEDGVMVVYNSKGGAVAECGPGSGVIQATQSPWNPDGVGACENVVWVVSGTDEAGVKSAVDALINRHDGFQYACAVVVADGEIIKVPQ